MLAFRHHLRLWAIWIVAASALLLANPLGRFGWIELAAVLGPLAMLVDRRIWREPALAMGLPGITLLWLADPAGAPVWRLFAGWLVFGVGVLLAARTVDAQAELEEIAGQVAFEPSDPHAAQQFDEALERELGRARRHERAFAILSAAALPGSLNVAPAGTLRPELARELVENRARLELRDFLKDELHVYSDVAVADGRVLALIPEVAPEATPVLIERLQAAAGKQLHFQVQMGVGCFPADAVCADELVAAADRDRSASKLRSLADRSLDRVEGSVTELAPDVQG